MNINKRKNFFAVSVCLLAALINSVPNVNAAPVDVLADGLEDMSISILRNPSITDPDRRLSSFMVPQLKLPIGPAQQAMPDETKSFIPDELRTPLNLSKDVSDAVTTKIPGTEIELHQSAKCNSLQNYTSKNKDGTDLYKEVYTISDGVVNYKPVVVREPIIVSGPDNDPENRPKVYFNWLIISQGTFAVFRNLDISGRIGILGKSNMIFENCNIHNNNDPHEADYAVEICAGSKAKFENCIFDAIPSARICVVVRDKWWNGPTSEACFSNCKFSDCKVGVFAMNSANLQLFNCEFSKCNNISVLLRNNVNAIIKNCKFTDMNGKAIVLNDSSNVEIEDCKFLKCRDGAITGKNSNAKLVECDIFEPKSTAMHFVSGCKFNILKCRTSKVLGNCLNIESSNGHISYCTFSSDAPYPVIAVTKPNSSPIIENCSVEQLATKGNGGVIVTRHSASPILKGVSVRYADSTAPGMICANLSHPTLIGTSFEIINSDKIPEIRVFDAAKLKLFVAKDEVNSIKEDVTDLSLLDPFKSYLSIVEKRHGGVAFLSSDKEIECNKILPLNSKLDNELDDESGYESENKPENDLGDELDKLLGDKFDEKFYNAIDNMCHKTLDDDRIMPILPCAHVLCSCPKCNSKNIMFDPNMNEIKCGDCESSIDFSKMDFRCPTCKRLVRNNNQLNRMWKAGPTCLICMENPATNFFMNCGHKCVCSGCKQKLIKKNFGESCPCCNELSRSSGIDFLSGDNE